VNKNLLKLSSQDRCRLWRQRILEISQSVSALHIAPAFSCIEIVDSCYFNLMKMDGLYTSDIFIMSKGHGCMAQYVILEGLGIISTEELNRYCKSPGILGAHPDYGTPGVHASTGSLGHGLGLAVGQAYAERLKGTDLQIYCLLSDGELQEGSSWEAVMMAANLNLTNIVAFVDYNDFGGLEKLSVGHPAFAPLEAKFEAFGWEAVVVDGHDSHAIIEATGKRSREKPFVVIGQTIKGKGVSFMQDVAIWHYRSPTVEEYEKALSELSEILS
jgi:transketolase